MYIRKYLNFTNIELRWNVYSDLKCLESVKIWVSILFALPVKLKYSLRHLIMDIGYTWIYWQWKICRQSIYLAYMDLFYWSVPSSSMKGDGINGVDVRYCYFIQLPKRVHENLVQYPIIDISIHLVVQLLYN